MLLYVILVSLLVVFIIWTATLVVKKRRKPYKPEPIDKIDDLNKLDDLLGTVKKKPEPKPEPRQQSEEKTQDQDKDFKEYSSGIDENKEEQEPSGQPSKFSGRRGKPPKRPPRPNLREAMKNSEILGKPKAKQ